MNKVAAAATVLLLATIGSSALAYAVYLFDFGQPGLSAAGGTASGLGSPGAGGVRI